MKIGIFGGTFDPPHYGHIKMAKDALDECGLDKVIFIPNKTPAYKMAMHEVTGSEHRYDMLKLMVEECEWAEVSDIELRRDGNTYTKDTLRELCALYPDDEWFLIIGSDSFKDLKIWKEPQEIFNRSTVVVLLRDTDSFEEMNSVKEEYTSGYGARVIIVNNNKENISSSKLRYMLSNGFDVRAWINNSVMEYIIDNDLYNTGDMI